MNFLATCHRRHVSQRSCPALNSDDVGFGEGKGKKIQVVKAGRGNFRAYEIETGLRGKE